MHRLANSRSTGLSSSSSKCSRNVGPSSPLCRRGEMEGHKGNFLMQDHTILTTPSSAIKTTPPKTQPHNPPQDLNQFSDTSDSDDCESVGSNSPALDVINGTYNTNNKNIGIDKSSLKHGIHCNSPTMKENLTNIHDGTRNPMKVSENKIGNGGNQEPQSTFPISKKNYSNVGFPHKAYQSASNNTYHVRSNKDPQVGGSTNGYPEHTPNPLNKSISRIGNPNHSSKTRHTLPRDIPRVHNNNAKRNKSYKTFEQPNDNIDFDEGDGGGLLVNKISSEPHVNKYNNNKKYHVLQTQDKNEKSNLESFDEGDEDGFHPHPSARRRRLVRHGRQSRRGSSGRSSRGSRHGSRGSNRSSSHSSSSQSSRGSSRSRRLRRKSRSRKASCRSSCGSSRNSGKSYHSSETWEDGLSSLHDTKPYPSNWRCFGRRPPAIHEFRPLGDVRVKNVRPAGKLRYLMRDADERPRCIGIDSTDKWDNCYGLAKPITDQWSNPLPYGTQVIRAGDIDPYFHPSRGDIVIINPAQNYYRAVKSGYVMTYRGQDYSFGVGDLIIHLGRFMPNGEYIPYGNLELYMHTQTREMRLLGRQPFLLVDFNYHNLDYESPGKYLAVGTFLNESFFPRRGDIIIRGGAWAENYPNIQRKHHSSVKYWRPRMEFLPNDMLLRPYVDIGRKVNHPSDNRNSFYWGAAELYSYSGKGLAWAYWGRDHHICDTPYPREQEHGIKTGHHKDEVGHYGDYGVGYSHGHQGNDDCHSQHNLSHKHRPHKPHGHQAEDDCHREHELSRHPRR